MVMYQLRKEYPGSGGKPPHIAVHSVSLVIQRNECFGLLGPNGTTQHCHYTAPHICEIRGLHCQMCWSRPVCSQIKSFSFTMCISTQAAVSVVVWPMAWVQETAGGQQTAPVTDIHGQLVWLVSAQDSDSCTGSWYGVTFNIRRTVLRLETAS